MKKLISLALVLCMVFLCFAATASAYGWTDPDIWTVDQAVEDYEFLMEEEVETNRYYFLMPNGSNGDLGDDESLDDEGNPVGNPGEYAPTWYIPMADGSLSTQTAGIYWWDSGVADPAAWVGYLPSGEDENDPNVYYADVPQAVTTLIWNNAVDGGMDETDPIFYCAAQSINIPCEYYDAGESPNYPDGTESFDNMIFVIDPDLISVAEFSGKQTCGGEWYYYYGNGCYGFTKDGSEADCLRDDHHDADGKHVVPEAVKPTAGETVPTEAPTPAPTEAPTPAPTEPTEAPTPAPTEAPTPAPTEPTEAPTPAPTEAPTPAPTEPTEAPTPAPTEAPTPAPTPAPTEAPTVPSEPEFDLGDVNGDNVIDIMDTTAIQMHMAKLDTLTNAELKRADTTKDAIVDVTDATRIQMFIAKLIMKF